MRQAADAPPLIDGSLECKFLAYFGTMLTVIALLLLLHNTVVI